jgi:hypothetical protein
MLFRGLDPAPRRCSTRSWTSCGSGQAWGAQNPPFQKPRRLAGRIPAKPGIARLLARRLAHHAAVRSVATNRARPVPATRSAARRHPISPSDSVALARMPLQPGRASTAPPARCLKPGDRPLSGSAHPADFVPHSRHVPAHACRSGPRPEAGGPALRKPLRRPDARRGDTPPESCGACPAASERKEAAGRAFQNAGVAKHP